MAYSLSSFVVFFVILSTTSFLSLPIYGMGGFSVELIHRDSPKSPFYESNSTASSRFKAAAERSLSRAIYLQNAIQNNHLSFASAPSPSAPNFFSNIIPNGFEYLMRFYIGSTAKEILAIADTGSDLIWVQCKPCDECFHESAPLFDPQASSSYKVISCNTDSCSALLKGSCGSGSQCEYNYKYGDGSFVDGFLSSETVSFNSTSGRVFQIPSTVFGCTHRSNGMFDKNDAGLVGLGGGKLSLIRQLGSAIESKFSYCLPSYDQTSSTSRLNFGSSAVVSDSNAVTTPLISGHRDTFYFLSLEQISVDGQGGVPLKPRMRVAANKGNIIIDSGTTLTLIDNDTLESVETKIMRGVSFPQVTDPNDIFNLCFNISAAGDNVKLPDITFHFSGGAPVVLHKSNAFVEVAKNTVCLALVSRGDIGVNIFGNIAQQNFHIGYDLNAMQLTFAPVKCVNL